MHERGNRASVYSIHRCRGVAETKAQLRLGRPAGHRCQYRRQQVELKTVEMGNRDLDHALLQGLEKALRAFHSADEYQPGALEPIIRYLFAT
jgi:hypothetical protein